MRIKEVRDLNMDELQQKEKDLIEERFKLNFRNATGQLDSPSALKKVRRDLARVKTILREREESR